MCNKRFFILWLSNQVWYPEIVLFDLRDLNHLRSMHKVMSNKLFYIHVLCKITGSQREIILPFHCILLNEGKVYQEKSILLANIIPKWNFYQNSTKYRAKIAKTKHDSGKIWAIKKLGASEQNIMPLFYLHWTCRNLLPWMLV